MRTLALAGHRRPGPLLHPAGHRWLAQSAADNPVVGHVYQPTNDAAGNAVAVYDRYADGSLDAVGSVPTGGLGTGASLASQGASPATAGCSSSSTPATTPSPRSAPTAATSP